MEHDEPQDDSRDRSWELRPARSNQTSLEPELQARRLELVAFDSLGLAREARGARSRPGARSAS